MNLHEQIIIAVFIALFLLSLCVLLFSSSLDYPSVEKYIFILLWCFGILPGLTGVIWGFIEFVRTNQPILIIFSFLLLEFGSLALIRATKKVKEKVKV